MMDEAAVDTTRASTELPITAYPHHHRVFGAGDGVPTGLLFDNQTFAVMSITHPPDLQTPDLNVDKDGDRILILVNGDLTLQIGDGRFRMGSGDAVQIPKGTRFGRSRSDAGAHLLMIRAKPVRSFSIMR